MLESFPLYSTIGTEVNNLHLIAGPSVSRSDSMTPPPTTAAVAAGGGIQRASVTDYERLFAETDSEEEDEEDEVEDDEAAPAAIPTRAADEETAAREEVALGHCRLPPSASAADAAAPQGCQMAKFDPFLSLDCGLVYLYSLVPGWRAWGRNPRK